MKQARFVSLLLMAVWTFTAYGQGIRYLHPVFDSVSVSNTFYGMNVTILSVPTTGKGTRVPLPVSIYSPTGDTVKNRPLVIYIHTGNFLPFPQNQGTAGRTVNGGALAALGMGFPVDSPLVEICTRLAKMGYVVAAIDYRTGWNPVASTQTERVNTLINAAYRGVQDFRTAVRFFKKTFKEAGNPYGIDTSKIVAWGQGSGGYVSLASSVLDNYLDIPLASKGKFIGPDITGDGFGDPYVLPPVHGDIYGTSLGINPTNGDTLSLPNHVGYSSDFQLSVNMGGALPDTLWLDATDLPLISFQEPRDPFAPYKEGLVLVPRGTMAPLPVVEVQGSYLAVEKARRLGLQKKMIDLKLNDVYTQAANVKNDGIEGLYPISGNPLNPLDSDPWNWWDTAFMASVERQAGTGNNTNGLLTNPDMSAAKARRYIDTIIGYYAPRAFAVLNLGTFTNTPDLLKDTDVGFKLMPNPMVNQTLLQTNPDFPMKSVTLYDLNGRVVRKLSGLNTNSITVHRNELSQGAYILQVGFKKGVISKTLLIQ